MRKFLVILLFLASVCANARVDLTYLGQALNGFKTITFETRGSRGGNGDVASSYLMALEFIERFHYRGTLQFLVDDISREILSTLSGVDCHQQNSLFGGKIHLVSYREARSKAVPIDLYVQLALPDADLQFPLNVDRLPLSPSSVIVTQTVFGGSEAFRGSNRTGTIRIGRDYFRWAAAGLGPRESGIYYDVVAAAYAPRNPTERRQMILKTVEPVAHLSQGFQMIHDVLGHKVLVGAETSTVYGIWQKRQRQHFVSYLRGLSQNSNSNSNSSSRSFAFFSPLPIKERDLPASLRSKIRITKDVSQLPSQAEPGIIYILLTGKLPHEVFVGLLANAQIPPVVAGDGALSATLRLGDPFLMTKVDWNATNLRYMRQRLLKFIAGDEDKALIERVFPAHGTKGPDLSEGLRFLEPHLTMAFRQAASSIPLLSETMLRTILYNDHGPSAVRIRWMTTQPDDYQKLYVNWDSISEEELLSKNSIELVQRMIFQALELHGRLVPDLADRIGALVVNDQIMPEAAVGFVRLVTQPYPNLDPLAIVIGSLLRRWSELDESKRKLWANIFPDFVDDRFIEQTEAALVPPSTTGRRFFNFFFNDVVDGIRGWFKSKHVVKGERLISALQSTAEEGQIQQTFRSCLDLLRR